MSPPLPAPVHVIRPLLFAGTGLICGTCTGRHFFFLAASSRHFFHFPATMSGHDHVHGSSSAGDQQRAANATGQKPPNPRYRSKLFAVPFLLSPRLLKESMQPSSVATFHWAPAATGSIARTYTSATPRPQPHKVPPHFQPSPAHHSSRPSPPLSPFISPSPLQARTRPRTWLPAHRTDLRAKPAPNHLIVTGTSGPARLAQKDRDVSQHPHRHTLHPPRMQQQQQIQFWVRMWRSGVSRCRRTARTRLLRRPRLLSHYLDAR